MIYPWWILRAWKELKILSSLWAVSVRALLEREGSGERGGKVAS